MRTLALHTQGLAVQESPGPVTRDRIYEAIGQIGCLQIDTLQMVQRSQYVALWSRLGTYNADDLDALAYDPDSRRLFEYWWHAACYLPVEAYRYALPTMRWYQEGGGRRNPAFLDKEGSQDVVEHVLERIHEEGGLRAADFEHDRKERGTWWDWKPAKRALEYLYDRGDLMITNRVNFQRVYDLRERVLPDWVDTSEPTAEEAVRYRLESAVRAMGICQPNQPSDYYSHMKRTEAKPAVEALVGEGVFVEVTATLTDGETHNLIVHRDNLSSLEQAADGALMAGRTTFLSPFDSLFYPQGRDMQLWNFRQVLEAYKPADQREWGYFCLPILHKDRLVGRFDPKLERDTGTLRLKALYLEPGVAPDDELVQAVAAAMTDFMAFHDANDLVIEQSEPGVFGKKVLQNL